MSWWQRLENKARGVYGATPPPKPKKRKQADGGCDHGEIHLRQGTAEFEWFVARGELELGQNLEHGANHLANLLTYDPDYPEWVELLEEYLQRADSDPERLFPRGEKLYYGTEAVRAYIWHRQGKLEEAINLLWNVVQAKPDSRYMEAWGLKWLEPPGMIESLSRDAGLQVLMSVLTRYPEAALSPLPKVHQARRWARLADRFLKDDDDPGLAVMLRAGLLRKAGLFDEAKAVVGPVLKRTPNWHAAVALGLILRAEGKVEEAEDAFKEALDLDPKDVSARLEAGDMYFDRQEWEPALKWYQNALKKERGQPWAKASSLYCRWKLDKDERDLEDLVALAKKENPRAGELCQKEFFGQLPEPADATANGLRQIRKEIRKDPKNAPDGEVRMTLSSLEAPSNFLAFRLEMEALGHELTLAVDVERVPKPDPRKPLGPVKWVLWKYKGTDPEPGLPKPPKEVTKAIARLARQPYDELRNWAAASRVAAELGPERAEEVLATMVHPPPVPEGRQALHWVPRVQMAAAQVLGQLDGEWDGSVRREALLSVLHGPQDWATEAAVRVMAWLGRENEAYAPDIHDAFQVLADARPDRGYCSWERTLFSQWITLPHLYPDERSAMEEWLKSMDAE
jgi:tetratricopeptide (TPR) repeat protein